MAGFVEYALTHAPDFAAAAVVSDGNDYGLWEYLSYQEFASGALTNQYTALYGGTLSQVPKVWLAEAPDLLGAKLKTPLRIQLHGLEGVLEQWGIYAAARANKTPVELAYYPDIHSLLRVADRRSSLSGSLDWFRFWLEGYEDPDPAKRGQYASWERLCGEQLASGRQTSCARSRAAQSAAPTKGL
jgi:hypothetical protein